MNLRHGMILAAFVALGLIGCASSRKMESAPVAAASVATNVSSPASQPPSRPVNANPVVAPAVNSVVLPAHLDPMSAISTTRSVYFDFDDFTVKPQGFRTLESHARYLVQNPSLHVKLEGNADERGGSEYNLALGQKRAESVMRSLKTLGVKDAQMEAVSWGKEKPKALGHDEAAWAQNRRVDMTYPAK